jgi:hypothetical protein
MRTPRSSGKNSSSVARRMRPLFWSECDHLDVRIDFAAQQLAGTRQLVVVLRLGGELAGAHEIAGDVLLLHHRLDRVDSRSIGLVKGARFLRAETSGQRSEIMSQSAVAMAAVAAGRLADDAARFEHGHGRAALRQRERRRQPGEARADDDNVGTS